MAQLRRVQAMKDKENTPVAGPPLSDRKRGSQHGVGSKDLVETCAKADEAAPPQAADQTNYRAISKAAGPEGHIAWLEKELSNRDVTLRAIQRNFETISKQRSDESTRHSERKEALDRMSEKFHETDKALIKEKQRAKENIERVSALEAENSDLKIRFRNKAEELDRLKAATEADRKKSAEQEKAVAKLQRELSERQRTQERAEAKLVEAQAKLSADEAKQSEGTSLLAAQGQELAELRRADLARAEEVKTLEGKVGSLKRMTSRLEEQMADMAATHEREFGEMKRGFQERFDEMREMRDVNARALMDERARHKEQRDKAAQLIVELTSARRASEELQHQVRMGEHTGKKLEEQLAASQAAMAELQQQVHELSESVRRESALAEEQMNKLRGEEQSQKLQMLEEQERLRKQKEAELETMQREAARQQEILRKQKEDEVARLMQEQQTMHRLKEEELQQLEVSRRQQQQAAEEAQRRFEAEQRAFHEAEDRRLREVREHLRLEQEELKRLKDAELARKEAELQATGAQLASIKDEQLSSSRRFAEVRAELEKAITRERATAQRHQDEVNSMRQLLDEADKRSRRAESDLCDAREQIESLVNMNDSLSAEVAEQKRRSNQLDQVAREWQSKTEAVSEQLHEMKTTAARAETMLESVKAMVEEEKGEASREVEVKEQLVQQMSLRVAEIEAKQQQVEVQKEMEIARLQTQQELLKEQQQQREETLIREKQDIADRLKREHEARRAESEARASRIEEAIHELQLALANAKKEKEAALRDKVVAETLLREERAANDIKLHAIEREVKLWEQKATALEKRVADEQAACKRLIEQLELEKVDTRHAELEKQRKELLNVVAKIEHIEDAMGGSLACSVCLDTMKQAVTAVPCGHCFCAECFQAQQTSADKKVCPECKTGAPIRSLITNATLDNICSKFIFQRQAIASLTTLVKKGSS